MMTGHGSHQIGLDADIWLTPMPPRTLSPEERETMSATNVVAADGTDVDAKVWTPQHGAFIRLAAAQPEVSRVFVNPAIKKALCREAGADRAWLRRCGPGAATTIMCTSGSHCPAGAADCTDQPGAGRRWLRRRAGRVVPGGDPQTQAVAACAALDTEGLAGSLQRRAFGKLTGLAD